MWVPGNIPKGPRRKKSELKQELMLFEEAKSRRAYGGGPIGGKKGRALS
jgi:hypothetical protein